jgi:hypothetical protein
MNLHGPGWPGNTAQDKRIIQVAIVASVLLHVVLGVATWHIPLKPGLADLQVREPVRDVELILENETPEPAPKSDQPTTYVSVPERQAAAEAPDNPDYLALYHSVAADNKLGDSNRPSADEEGSFENVEIRKEDLDGAGGVEFSPQPQAEQKPATNRLEAGAKGTEQEATTGDSQQSAGEWALPDQSRQAGREAVGKGSDQQEVDSPALENWWGGQRTPSILKAGEKGQTGDRGFDFNQKATGSLTSGVAISGEFQLNTVQWDWAPWLQVFSNELYRHWVAPPAYQLGLLSGTTVIRLVIEKDGRPSSMDIVDRDGHESLHGASVAALKAFAPYLPLPAHFPEENLVITLSLHYPAFRR